MGLGPWDHGPEVKNVTCIFKMLGNDIAWCGKSRVPWDSMFNHRPPFKGDRSEGLPIKNRHFPIENPLVVVESVDFRGFLTYFGIFGPRMK